MRINTFLRDSADVVSRYTQRMTEWERDMTLKHDKMWDSVKQDIALDHDGTVESVEVALAYSDPSITDTFPLFKLQSEWNIPLSFESTEGVQGGLKLRGRSEFFADDCLDPFSGTLSAEWTLFPSWDKCVEMSMGIPLDLVEEVLFINQDLDKRFLFK